MAQDETTSGTEKKRRGRRLRSPENLRAALAHLYREIEADTTIKPEKRARLLSGIAAQLVKTLELADHVAKRDEKVRKLESAVERLVAERQRMAS